MISQTKRGISFLCLDAMISRQICEIISMISSLMKFSTVGVEDCVSGDRSFGTRLLTTSSMNRTL